MKDGLVHYAGSDQAVTACGKIKSLVTATGSRRMVTCPTCSTKIKRS